VYWVQWDDPQVIVDITDTFETKLQAIGCHATQIGDLAAFEARMRTRAEAIGKAKGCAYAEGFDRIVVPG